MNTNPKAKRILCFGDSNTWGFDRINEEGRLIRYPANVRWTGVLQNTLGEDYEIIEEGLNSRGILRVEEGSQKDGRVGVDYLKPCLDTHYPLDFAVVMLGTCELKNSLGLSVEEIGQNLEKLVDIILNRSTKVRNKTPRVVVVVPPILDETTKYASEVFDYSGAPKKALALGSIYKKIAEEKGCLFVNVQDKMVLGEDGVHIAAESHEVLGKAIAKTIKKND